MAQKDQGYAWVILLAGFLARIVASMGEGMMGVLVVELSHSFDASSSQIIAASTTQLGVFMGACK